MPFAEVHAADCQLMKCRNKSVATTDCIYSSNFFAHCKITYDKSVKSQLCKFKQIKIQR